MVKRMISELSKMNLTSDEKRNALKKIRCAKYYKLMAIEYVSDKDIFRYKNDNMKEWLKKGDIIKYKTDYFVYLGYTKPTEKLVIQLTHHVLNEHGERFSCKWSIEKTINKVNVTKTFNNCFLNNG